MECREWIATGKRVLGLVHAVLQEIMGIKGMVSNWKKPIYFLG